MEPGKRLGSSFRRTPDRSAICISTGESVEIRFSLFIGELQHPVERHHKPAPDESPQHSEPANDRDSQHMRSDWSLAGEKRPMSTERGIQQYNRPKSTRTSIFTLVHRLLYSRSKVVCQNRPEACHLATAVFSSSAPSVAEEINPRSALSQESNAWARENRSL